MAQKLRRDAGQAWIERTNPLRGLSIREAQMIFDAARGGDTQRLHWIFQEIEAANPTLMTCVERRASALAALMAVSVLVPLGMALWWKKRQDARGRRRIQVQSARVGAEGGRAS